VQPVISAEQMREIDRLTTRDYQVPSLSLMQAAADACFAAISNHFGGELSGKRAQILCGPGNNGGDGAALAIALCGAGVLTEIVLFGTVAATKGDARTSFETAQEFASQKAKYSLVHFSECKGEADWDQIAGQVQYVPDLIVDALFGTGLTRPLEGVFRSVAQYLKTIRVARDHVSDVRTIVVSVDIPSGLNANVSQIIGPTVEADLTITFTAAKPANVLAPACHYNGKLVVASIGSPDRLVEEVGVNLFIVEEKDARNWLTKTRYTPDSFKNTHGHVLVIAGSRGYTGAAVLCGNAAMRSGAGLVTIATPSSAQSAIAATVMPEVMTTALAETDRGAVSDAAIDHVMQLAAKVSVIAIGPGLSAEDERTLRFVYSVVKQRRTPVVIDADALNCLARYSSNGWPEDLQGSEEAPLILTPHAGEMLRLLGTTDKTALDDRVAVARDFATKHKLILVLKGTRSLIAAPDGRVFINPTGNAGLGTAGAGDTLTGIIAGFIAQAGATLKKNADPLLATIAALYVGGLAGDFAARELGMRTMVASDIREHLSEAIRSLDPEGETP
jgi:NAD(P)H-hydrate epimerase